VAAARASLNDDQAWTQAWTEGREMTAEQAAREAGLPS
jgi:hypothetical protein